MSDTSDQSKKDKVLTDAEKIALLRERLWEFVNVYTVNGRCALTPVLKDRFERALQTLSDTK